MRYIDAVCGSGKTTKAIAFAAKSAIQFNNLFVIAQPTTDLITQSIQFIKLHHPDAQAFQIDGITCLGKVYSTITNHMSNWDWERDGGCVVFITHAALWEMPYFPYKANWELIIDEIPDVDFEFQLNLPETNEWTIKSLLQSDEIGENLVVRLKAKPGSEDQVKKWASNKKNDDVIKVLQPLYKEISSQHSKVYATRASWNRLDQKGYGKLIVHGFRGPSVCESWKSCRIMGAHFTKSMLYHLWQSQGVDFEKDTTIKVDGEGHAQELGKRLKIFYFSAKPWSKRTRDAIAVHDDPLASIRPVIKEVMGEEAFLWAANKDIEDFFVTKEFGKAVRIPNVPHGRNDFRTYTNIAFLSALNNTPAHFSNMDKVWGISPEHLREGRYFQVAYQAIMRTALRQPDNANDVKVLVPDIGLAQWLVKVFPGAKLQPVDPPEECQALLGDALKARGAPRKEATLSNLERKKQSVEKAERLLVTKNTIYKALIVTNDITLSHESSVVSKQILKSSHQNWNDLRLQLKELHDEYQPTKEANTLASGAMFDASKSGDTAKGLANIQAVNGIWLDFDNGELSPDEFRRMFPEVKWLIWNSFNNGKDNQRKYRVLFPTASLMTAEMYHTLWDVIAQRIESFGYYIGSAASYEKQKQVGRPMPPRSGLDISKRTANSFFYLPCRAGLGKKHTFWMENWGEQVVILNPDVWVKYAPIEKQQYVSSVADTLDRTAGLKKLLDAIKIREEKTKAEEHRNELARQKAIDDWRNAPAHEGNQEFFRLGMRLHNSGMGINEVERVLRTEAANAKSPRDRIEQIKWILKSLRKAA